MAVERLIPGTWDWEHWHADHVARYLFAVPHAKDRSILDAGTGCGYGAAILATQGAASVHGVDVSDEAIRYARENFQLPNLAFKVDDCEQLATISGKLDVICSFENIEHLKQPHKFLRRAADLLNPSGVFLCSTPDKAATAPFQNGKPANPFHQMEWTPAEFANMLARYFRSVDLLSQVKSRSASARKEAIDSLAIFLNSSFGTRISRYVRRALRMKTRAFDLAGLGIPYITDFPIVPQAVSGLFGSPWCVVAFCRDPIGA
jgi:2-polyprenyl-3-methyl-5-hydroxy-6-metoxy-1,4-benzoquinol methylase